MGLRLLASGVALVIALSGCGREERASEPPRLAVLDAKPAWSPYDESTMAAACDRTAKAQLPNPDSFTAEYGWAAGQGAAGDRRTVERGFKAKVGDATLSSKYTCTFDPSKGTVVSLQLGAPFSAQ